MPYLAFTKRSSVMGLSKRAILRQAQRSSILATLLLIPILFGGCEHLQSQSDQADMPFLKTAARLEASGDLPSAIAIYEGALAKMPQAQKFPLYMRLGKALIQIGELERARGIFEEALQNDQENQAKKNLARCYLMGGKEEQALTIYERIIEEMPHDAETLNGLGIVFDTRGGHTTAQDFYRRALLEKPKDKDIEGNLGLSLALSKNYEEALAFLEPVGNRLESTRKQRHNLGVAYALSGQTERASEVFAKDLSPAEVEQNLRTLSMATQNKGSIIETEAIQVGNKAMASVIKVRDPEPQRKTRRPCDLALRKKASKKKHKPLKQPLNPLKETSKDKGART